MKKHFTIGLAGHIDHGKTTLTKALTGINTDRLKEEKTRNISIEPGFAPFIDNENLYASLIDVPGHENFIRQMIAGVAGIDLVMLVIDATEGMMPQTHEHLEILSLLGIKDGLIVLTKIDQADPELINIVEDDIQETLQNTFLRNAPLFKVDSLSRHGIQNLENSLHTKLQKIKNDYSNKPFRLPIDHVFTSKGQGVIARGTIYNGSIHEGDSLTILPTNQYTRVRQIQSHGSQVSSAYEGQRTAINLAGIALNDVQRGDVLVDGDFYTVSNRIDVSLKTLSSIQHPIKQRQLIKLYINTTEVMGRLIFFDRNIIKSNNDQEVLCQLELDKNIVVTRDDRFILRRPTPTETIGGGTVIDPIGKKLRFGQDSITHLKLKKEGTIEDRIITLLQKEKSLSKDTILKNIVISEDDFSEVEASLLHLGNDIYTLDSIIKEAQSKLLNELDTFHQKSPMKIGLNKAKLFSELKLSYPTELLDFALNNLIIDHKVVLTNQTLSLKGVYPTLPTQWQKKLHSIELNLIKQGAEPDKWNDLIQKNDIPKNILNDYYYYLLNTGRAFQFDDNRIISATVVNDLKTQLIENTQNENFTLQKARDILKLSRKNLVPFLELLDRLEYTERIDNMRSWLI